MVPLYIVGSDRDTRVAFGALLEICLAICGIATAAVIFPIAERVNDCVALGYVASRTVESILILVGVLSLMSIVGLRQDDLGTASTMERLSTMPAHCWPCTTKSPCSACSSAPAWATGFFSAT